METIGDYLNIFNIEVSRFSVTFTLILLFLGLLYWYSVYPYSVLSRCGIKHPKPMPFYGNIFMFREGFFRPLNNIIKTHGRVCGYYLGRRPVVVIADPDMLRQVMVKDFSSFPNRMTIRFASKPMTDCLLMLRNEQWKRVRSILTPSFSSAKMKEMVPLINTATNALMKNLDVHAESGEPFDIHRCFGCFTMDVIASVAFATQVDSQNNPDDPFVHHAQMFFTFSFFRPIMLFFIAFPTILAPFAKFIPNKRRDQMNNFFITCIQKIIKQREEQPPDQRRRDFLQLMLDARTSKDSVSLEHFDTANHTDETENRSHPVPSSASDQENGRPHSQESPIKRPQKKMMTEDEIVGQAFVFLLAGYETSSNTLGFTCYLLALHPECQQKVHDEVDDFFTRHDSPDYANVQELKYLDMVVSEALRLYPPGFRFARDIDEDCVVNGQFLPKGATLEIPAGFLHYDPEHWPEPEKFIPERMFVYRHLLFWSCQSLESSTDLMVPLINTATNALMKNLDVHAESGEPFDIHRCFGCFTMDVIASVAFATQVDSQNNPDDPFVHHAQMFFTFSFFRPIMLFFIAFPTILAPFAKFIPNKRRDQMNNFFITCIQKIIKQREEQPPDQRRRDFLQLMLDARTSKDSVSLEHFDTANHTDEPENRSHPVPSSASDQENGHPHSQESPIKRPQKKMMTEDEIVGQAFVFLLAGYETSSNTLGFTCYLLALHPECQQKVHDEVDDFFTRHDSPDYANVQELKYLDMVVSEALRLYPPGFRFARDIDEDCVVNGQFLPKGATLEIPAGFLHYDPEHWPEPEKFIPERFTPEAKASRHPFVYLPFGAGPRNCVGMRLAQLEIRMALVHLFRRFSIVACSETKVPLDLKSSSTLGPKSGIFVKITRRDGGDGLGDSPSDD